MGRPLGERRVGWVGRVEGVGGVAGGHDGGEGVLVGVGGVAEAGDGELELGGGREGVAGRGGEVGGRDGAGRGIGRVVGVRMRGVVGVHCGWRAQRARLSRD